MYTLIANYDTSNGYKAHFCGKECLMIYVEKKVKEHYDLPNVTDENRDTEKITYGDILNDKEQSI
jgi:hypothetical protein